MDAPPTPSSRSLGRWFPLSGAVRETMAYIVVVGLMLLLLVVFFDLLHRDWSVPLLYTNGDASSVQLWVKGLMDNPWLLHNDYLGAPAGHDLHDYPTCDSLQFLLLKLLGTASGSPFTAITL